MTAGPARPLVAVVYTVPLLCEALAELADVQTFRSGLGTASLLASLRPSVVIVDSDADAAVARAYAAQSRATAIHVSLVDNVVRVLRDGEWSAGDAGASSPDAVRACVASNLFGARV